MKISVVIPVYNEENSIHELVYRLKEVLDKKYDYEIIFVNDGSTDRTLERIKIEKVKVIDNSHRGKAFALQKGFDATTGDIIITMDGDLQDDPREIPNLIRKIEQGYDLVSGWKRIRYDPLSKTIPSKIFNKTVSLFSGITLHDFNCGLKAYRRRVIERIRIYGEMHRFIPAIAYWEGFRVGEIPVHHHPRKYGETKYGAKRFLSGFFDLMTLLFLHKFSKKPLHFFGILGLITMIPGFLILLYLTIDKLAFGQTIYNRPLLLLGVLLVIIGIQSFSTGFLGELIVRKSESKE